MPERSLGMRMAALAAACCCALPALAGREPVLKQIKVPHHYYYREMYLPQATSGPSAVTWSPDGNDLVYSMQGSLWRQRLGSTRAEQITSGPGYDYQPDWSPDGRFIAFASYRDDAVELWLLEVASGKPTQLTRNGAVNVEPRWSPDGKRLAFVSTMSQQRFHIHILSVDDGRPGDLELLTEDNDSGLPRYYYSRFDHFISPCWSPDGRELLFVSNRGHVQGSGGFWRMKARPGAEPREIRYEETTWKARPDWSPDGKRVIYSSYLGRQWHQLWIMTAEGGDPFPLTYGEYDVTAARWSPDGGRIAYISNEGGNTSLWIQEIPGGGRQRLQNDERRYLAPVGRLKINVVDAANGAPIPARISVTGADGRGFTPDDAWRHADDGFDRAQRKFEATYFHSPGSSELSVPAGEVEIEVLRGLEYRAFRQRITIAAGATRALKVELRRLANLAAEGWTSGDLHVHMNYGGAYRNDPRHLAFQAAAEDLHVVESLIVNKEQRIPDISYFSGKPDPASTASVLIFHSQEYHTSYWGHTGLLGLTRNILIPGYAAYVNTAAASLFPANAAVLDLAHAQGAITGYVHPFDKMPDPRNTAETLHHEIPVDVALGKVDYYEAVGFNEDPFATADVWYRLLNCGFRLPAGAGTDAMANFASLRGPVGLNRVYVNTGQRFDHARFLEGIKAGRTFATNAPLLQFTLAGKGIGGEIRLPRGAHVLEARATLKSIVPIDHFEIVANGKVVAALALSGERTAASATRNISVERSGWYTLRAWSEHATHPVLDFQPFGTTSPIYVTVGDEPVRSREDAEFFLAWIDRLAGDARDFKDWNTAAEKESVLKTLQEGRAVYLERRGP